MLLSTCGESCLIIRTQDDLKHGKGLFRYAHGDFYDGDWKLGIICHDDFLLLSRSLIVLLMLRLR